VNQRTGESPDPIIREIRFAVVMYGGVSLAVYMNGIAQELLNLVCSTSAIDESHEPKSGTLPVYREIASYLSGKTGHAFEHKFVVDIISGTSAGGINGICLAKGLVRGLEDLKTLEMTWLDTGDIDTLLNDKASEPRRYTPKEPKTSLFNSQRMYGLLLKAFSDMEDHARDKKAHVDSMDLFVTATDILGLQLPILVGDGQVNERIHKHVFPFTFRSGEYCGDKELNHFRREFDPILAFASRCTSSFPVAFEPVTIEDVRNWIDLQGPRGKHHAVWQQEQWRDLFFSTYLDVDDGIQLEKRPFADGGYLDNRPFGHAIRSIHARKADCPIQRKLIFIDPKPEMPDERRQAREISFAENLATAASLPQYETIREELDGISSRNDWIETVNGILDCLQTKNENELKTIIRKQFVRFTAENEPDASTMLFSGNVAAELLRGDSATGEDANRLFWREVSRQGLRKAFVPEPGRSAPARAEEPEDFGEMSILLGDSYPAYHYTRLDDTTKQISCMLVRAMNAEHRRETRKAVEQIVAAWRSASFVSSRDEAALSKEAETENLFFRFFDLDFRIRRLNFFRRSIEKSILDQSANRLLFGLIEGTVPLPEWDDSLEEAVRAFYHRTVAALRSLYRLRSLLFSGPARNPLADEAKVLRTRVEHLLAGNHPEIRLGIDGVPLLPETFERIVALIDLDGQDAPLERKPFARLFREVTDQTKAIVRDGWGAMGNPCSIIGTKEVSARMSSAFAELGNSYPELAGRMRSIYDYGYDIYDCTWLPLISGGEFGEGTLIDVFRISPADSLSLWDDRNGTREKLAGVSLEAFGGFLDRQWRRNDVMWGRLDAAERIITALLSGNEDVESRNKLILKAQHAILLETTASWMNDLEKTRHTVPDDQAQYDRLGGIRDKLSAGPLPTPEQPGDKDGMPLWKTHFLSAYDFNRQIEPAKNLRRLGRGSAILSSMIDRLDGGNGILGRIGGYLKAFNRILLGMLDFSTPKSMPEVLGRYWLHLATLVALALVLGGTMIGRVSALADTASTVRSVGFALLFIVILIWILKQGFELMILRISRTYRQRLILRGMAIVLGLALFLTLFVAYETLAVFGNLLFTIFLNGFIFIINRQFGWHP
jgi:predicted acylesterase/phospholipase RssA